MTCVCFVDVDGHWRVDVVMSIRPSSSTGVLFALVSNDTIPLSVSVLSQEPNDAVKLPNPILFNNAVILLITILHFSVSSHQYTPAFDSHFPLTVPAGVFRQHSCCEARVVDAVLPRTLSSGDACVCSWPPDLCELLHRVLRWVWSSQTGFNQAQCHHAATGLHLRRRTARYFMLCILSLLALIQSNTWVTTTGFQLHP